MMSHLGHQPTTARWFTSFVPSTGTVMPARRATSFIWRLIFWSVIGVAISKPSSIIRRITGCIGITTAAPVLRVVMRKKSPSMLIFDRRLKSDTRSAVYAPSRNLFRTSFNASTFSRIFGAESFASAGSIATNASGVISTSAMARSSFVDRYIDFEVVKGVENPRCSVSRRECR